MFMKGVFMFFLSLGLGYGLCVVANKEKGILRTLGFTLGIAVLVLSFAYAFLVSECMSKCPILGKMGKMGQSHHMMKGGYGPCPMMK